MLRSQAWNLAKTWMKEIPKNPTLTCPVRTQWRGIWSLAQGALCPWVPHPPLQGHQKDWGGRGARVPADACGGQDSRVKGTDAALSGCLLFLRAPPLLVVAALAVLAALWHSHLPSPNCHKGSRVCGADTNSVTCFLLGFHFAVYITIQAYFPAGCPLSLWLGAVHITRKQAGCSSVLYLVPSSSCSQALF